MENETLNLKERLRESLYLFKTFDHTNLQFNLHEGDIKKLCGEAIENEYYIRAVCIYSYWVKTAKECLGDFYSPDWRKSKIKISPVIGGFPHGNVATLCKVHEAENALRDGANEIDLVMNAGAFLNEKYKYVSREIKEVVLAVNWGCVNTKVIIKAPLLGTYGKIIDACKLVEEAGADFVKDSTGFECYFDNEVYNMNAKVNTIEAMKHSVKLGVKAAGSIKILEDALRLKEAGANILGCSKTMNILNEAKGTIEEN